MAEPLRITVPNKNLTPLPLAEQDGLSAPSSTGVVAPDLATDIAAEEQNNIKTNIRDPAVITQVLSSGASEEDLVGYMSSQGMDETEARSILTNTVKSKILELKQQGISEADIATWMQENSYDPKLAEKALLAARPKKSLFDYDPNTPTEQAMDLADLYKSTYGKYSTFANKVLGALGNEERGVQARKDVDQLNKGIVDTLTKNGIKAQLNPEDGEILVEDENGYTVPLDDSLLNSIWNSKMNATGSIAGASLGAMGGAQVGAAAGAAIGSVVPVVGTVAGGVAGGVIGGVVGGFGGSAIGGALGTAADLTINAYQLKEQLSTELYKSQMVEAGVADMVFNGAIQTGVIAGKATWKGATKAVKYIKNGNIEGAFTQLIENLHMTKEEALDWIAEVSRKVDFEFTKERHLANRLSFGLIPVKNVPVKGTEKDIAVLLNTHPLAVEYVKKVASDDHAIANSMVLAVNNRAKSVNKAIAEISDDNTANLVRKDLADYVTSVKNFYTTVKEQGIKHVEGTDFSFDVNTLAIEPTLKKIETTIHPNVQERFLAHMTHIENLTKDRSFAGLLDLRKAVNEFKYSVALDPVNKDAINKVLNNIDSVITKAAKEYIPDSKQWLENFAEAKKSYAQMKVLQENALYKAITKASGLNTTEAGIQRLLNKFGNDRSVDVEVFNAISSRLAPATKMKVEAAAIKNLANKNTVGIDTELQAINFPALAEDLKMLKIDTPQGKQLVNAIEEMSKVFKNDEIFGGLTGSIQARSSGGSASIATSLVGKAQAFATRTIWGSIADTVISRLPGAVGRNTAILELGRKVLKNPLNSSTVDNFIKVLPEPSRKSALVAIKELQIEAAKANLKAGAKPQEWLNMYKQSASGKLVETDGLLGKGLYLFDKVQSPTPGAKIVKHEVNMTRMATLDSISKLVGHPVTEKDLPILFKNTNLKEQLIEQKMLGIKLDGKAMLFPNTTVGVKSYTKKAVNSAPKVLEAEKGIPQVKQAITKEVNPETVEINTLVKSLKSGEVRLVDAMEKAKTLGYTLHKVGNSGKASKDQTVGWIYRKLPKKGK